MTLPEPPQLRIGSYVAAVIVAAVAVVAAIRTWTDESPRVARAVAIAGRLASVTPGDDQAVSAGEADELAAAPVAAMIPCLAALGSATPAGANWLRSALDRAADRLGPKLKAGALEMVVRDVAQPDRARTLAFSWLRSRDARRADDLLEKLLDDPASDLRRAAVENILVSADSKDDSSRKRLYERALAFAHDLDQIERIAAWLGEHGTPVDVGAVLGFVRRWKVSDAFDNTGGTGFARTDPPEVGGSRPDTTGWADATSVDKYGWIDLNTAVARRKEVHAYAVAEVRVPRACQVEVRMRSPCAVVVWVNGTKVMTHELYHAGQAFDQYVAPAELRAGSNVVLVKCCQNEQAESWAGEWRFALRICDPSGNPVATTATGDGDAQTR